MTVTAVRFLGGPLNGQLRALSFVPRDFEVLKSGPVNWDADERDQLPVRVIRGWYLRASSQSLLYCWVGWESNGGKCDATAETSR